MVGTAAGQQAPAQDRCKRLRIDLRAGACGEQLGDRVGLLAGEAALLDRVRRAVPGCVDVEQAAYAPVLVDGNEAALVTGDAADLRTLDGRQRHDAFGLERRFAGQQL